MTAGQGSTTDTTDTADGGDDDGGADDSRDESLDKLDNRVSGVIKSLDKVNEKLGVDYAISEVSKIIETLDAKMAEFSNLKTKQDLATRKQKKAA